MSSRPIRYPDATSFFCRHLVAIVTKIEQKDGSQDTFAESAFPIEAGGKWFLLTAGHVLTKILTALNHPSTERGSTRLFDAWSAVSVHREPIPFNLDSVKHFAIDEDDGMDVGIIEIPDTVRRQLEANNVKAFDQSAWKQPPSKFDFFMVLGIPLELTVKIDGRLRVVPTVLPLQESKTPQKMAAKVDRFCGQLPAEIRCLRGNVLTDIKGLSGGPVLGFRFTEEGLTYHVVAIQTAWRRAQHETAGIYVETIGRGLELFGEVP